MNIREVLFIISAAVIILLYLGLATFVVTQNPRRIINWAFSSFCVVIANFYLTSLLLIPGPNSATIINIALKVKWAGISLAPIFFLHLSSFYFPPYWRKSRLVGLILAYLTGLGFAGAALFTDLLVAGPRHRPPPNIIGLVPGSLMYAFLIASSTLMIISTFGLIISYRHSVSPSRRKKIVYMLVPVGLIITGAGVGWVFVLAQVEAWLPHEIVHIIVVLLAFSLTRAVVSYGAFVGFPTGWRFLFYSMGSGLAILLIISITLTLDQMAMQAVAFPFPVITAGVLTVLTAGFPVFRRALVRRLDRWLFSAKDRRASMTRGLLETMSAAVSPDQLRTELLEILCTVLDVEGGYVATRTNELALNLLKIKQLRGHIGIRLHDVVSVPPFATEAEKPQLTALLAEPLAPQWGRIAMFYLLTTDSTVTGLVALGEKRDGSTFSPADLSFCRKLAQQFESVQQMAQVQQRRQQYLDLLQQQEETLHQLATDVTDTTRQLVHNWAQPDLTPPLETGLSIRLLGQFTVIRHGQPILAAEWKTEKAKALLAYLLWTGEAGARREELEAVLWPERQSDEMKNIFHVTLHYLRGVLEPDLKRNRHSLYIQHRGGKYFFNTEAPHWLDVTIFQQLVADQDMTQWEQAVNLYQGAYLADIGWTLPAEIEIERQRLEQLYLEALRRLAAGRRGRAAEAFL